MTTDPQPFPSLEAFFSPDVETDAEVDDGDGDVGARIEAARVATDIDRATLGARLGVDAETVADWESGETAPRSNQLVAIAGVLGVSPPWLMIGYGAALTAPSRPGATRNHRRRSASHRRA